MRRIALYGVCTLLVACSVVASVCGNLAAGEEKGLFEQEVLQTESACVEAILRGDVATLEKLLAEELVYTHSTGYVDTKASFLNTLKSGELKYEAMKHHDMQVRVYGEVAILVGGSSVQARSPRTGGQVMSIAIRFISVYAKKQGRWQQIAWQSTRIAPA